MHNKSEKQHSTKKNHNEQKKNSTKPDYFKRVAGFILILAGFTGCILTSPLIIAGGIIGLIQGLLTQTNPIKTGITGAKIGSFGFIVVLLWGLALSKANIEWEDSSPQNPKTQDNTSAKTTSDYHTEQKNTPQPFFTKPISATSKAMNPVNFNQPEEINTFIKLINKLILHNETQIPPIKENNLSNVKPRFIQTLITVTKNTKAPESDFWGRLEQMTDIDIKLYISQLNSKNGKGMHNSSELDYVWYRFKKTEFEPLIKEQKRKKLEPILKALSEEQLEDSFNSPNFLNIMNHDVYVATVANTLSAKQLQLFASDIKKQGILNNMIKSLKADQQLLGKLLAIMPYATIDVKETLIEQIAHLPYPASFNIELVKLAEHYIKKRMNEIYNINKPSSPQLNEENSLSVTFQ